MNIVKLLRLTLEEAERILAKMEAGERFPGWDIEEFRRAVAITKGAV